MHGAEDLRLQRAELQARGRRAARAVVAAREEREELLGPHAVEQHLAGGVARRERARRRVEAAAADGRRVVVDGPYHPTPLHVPDAQHAAVAARRHEAARLVEVDAPQPLAAPRVAEAQRDRAALADAAQRQIVAARRGSLARRAEPRALDAGAAVRVHDAHGHGADARRRGGPDLDDAAAAVGRAAGGEHVCLACGVVLMSVFGERCVRARCCGDSTVDGLAFASIMRRRAGSCAPHLQNLPLLLLQRGCSVQALSTLHAGDR